MTIEEMKARKRELGYTNKTISEKSGVPLSTVQKIFSGATFAPREATIRTLEKLLKPATAPELRLQDDGSIDHSAPHMLHESAVRHGEVIYEEIGPYRVKDYLALPDEERVELIDGYFYDMAAPNGLHQAVCGYLYARLLEHVTNHNGSCYPLISPFDVQLDQDDKTMIQPDVFVLCDRNKYQDGRIFGAPDLVIEVLSPSTRKKDMIVKMKKYADAGVREYWMIDTKKKVIIQYNLETLDPPMLYGFTSKIPVLIWGGSCTIDLKKMSRSIAFLTGEA